MSQSEPQPEPEPQPEAVSQPEPEPQPEPQPLSAETPAGYEYPPQTPPAPPVPTAPVIRRPALITVPDAIASVRDALVPLVVVMVLTFGVVVGLAMLVSSTGHGGFRDWFVSAVILTAGAFGAPAGLSSTSGSDSGSGFSSSDTGGLSFSLTESFEINLAAWIITFALVVWWARRAGRREAAAPSTSPGQVVARSVLSAFGVSLVLLVFALVSNVSRLYGLSSTDLGGTGDSSSGSGTVPFSTGETGVVGGDSGGFGSLGSLGGLTGGGGSAHGSVGVQPGWVFVGPLLVALAACLAGRLAAVARRPAGDPGGEWIRKLIAPWRAAGAVVRTQAYAVAALVGPTVLIYAEYRLLDANAPGRVKAAGAIVGVLLLPNFAVGGILTGFGATLFAGISFGGALSGAVGASNLSIGLFGNSRPWLMWLLIAEAVVGTVFPWILVRTRRRAVEPTAFAPAQVWRAALLGAVGAFLIATLGQASLSGSVSFVSVIGTAVTVGLIYSTFGAILAGVLWTSAAYLAVAFQVTPRVPAAQAVADPSAPPVQYGWPGAQAAPVAAAPAPAVAPAPAPAPDDAASAAELPREELGGAGEGV